MLAEAARQVAQEKRVPLSEGVYAMASGPSFETPAELRFLRTIGADAVGMSTVPEVIAARHLNVRVLAISCITNVALPGESDLTPEPNHAEVLAVAEASGERLAEVIQGVLERIGEPG